MVVTDETPDTVITVAERMQRAGIAADRARRYLVSSAVLLDGQRVTDPDTPAPPPARIVLLPA